ncbi:hypothetical protein LNV08_22920, partial [Paucibacter sp. TC2R-5]|uniref:hypothetical protein n=1 Tax=Paucibacter sp. TC2R-5 TaxID=2893555 RepID=UPI0021E4BAA5
MAKNISGESSKSETKLTISEELTRGWMKLIDKFKKKAAALGKLYATQDVREIGRHHTYYSGQRTELDYSKYVIYLYPTHSWKVPLVYSVGLGCDHNAGVIKGFTVTTTPKSIDTIRLYRRCVLPKSIWLPTKLCHLAQRWDVFGLEEIVAVDNGMDLISNCMAIVFMFCGVIVLRMPPKRGDLKGTIERTQQTIETRYISSLAGYVSPEHAGLNEKFSKVRQRAMRDAKYTVADFEEKLAEFC